MATAAAAPAGAVAPDNPRAFSTSSPAKYCRLITTAPPPAHRFAVRCVAGAEDRQVLFNRIAPVYDKLNDLLSLGRHRLWKKMTISWSGAKSGDRVLDLCCGSGDLAFLLAQKVGLDGQVKALDFSREQLALASARQHLHWKDCYKTIEWIEGDALDLPLEDSSFDAVTMGYGLRNVVDRPKALQEIFRVLKQGSKASILDFNKSTSPFLVRFQEFFLDNIVVPVATSHGLTEEYRYLKTSIRGFLTGAEQEELAKEVGFSEAKHHEIDGGLMGNLVVTK